MRPKYVNYSPLNRLLALCQRAVLQVPSLLMRGVYFQNSNFSTVYLNKRMPGSAVASTSYRYSQAVFQVFAEYMPASRHFELERS